MALVRVVVAPVETVPEVLFIPLPAPVPRSEATGSDIELDFRRREGRATALEQDGWPMRLVSEKRVIGQELRAFVTRRIYRESIRCNSFV